jgi:hypothetical protein
VTQAKLSGLTATAFTINAARVAAPVNVIPAIKHDVLVEYAPRVYGQNDGVLEIAVGPPLDATFRMPITGKSALTTISVAPTEVEFGQVSVGCRDLSQRIRIYNFGNGNRRLNRIQAMRGTSPEFQIDTGAQGNDINDNADDHLEILIRYRPTDAGFDSGGIVLTHDGAASPIVIPLFGEGIGVPQVTDTLRQTARGKVDVLFVVDGSADMTARRTQLAASAPVFIDAADRSLLDYQIAVTSMDPAVDGGSIYGGALGIVTKNTPNRAIALAALFTVPFGNDNNGRGAESSLKALLDPTLNVQNAGFVRDGADLVVHYISDEDDNSNRNRQIYRDYIRTFKGHGRWVNTSIGALVGTVDNDCDTPLGQVDYGGEYIRLANGIGGRITSLCTTDFNASLNALADESFGVRKTFPLSTKPASSSIIVAINGQLVPSVNPATNVESWRYYSDANIVRFFDGSVPAPNTSVQIIYAPFCGR